MILNFANCDMVGHTGVLEAAVKAVETVDTCVGRVVEATLKMGGIAMITADHGNAEEMTPARRQPHDRPYHQSRALYPLRRWHASCGRRPSGGYRPHHSGCDGSGLPAGDGR